MSLLDKYRIVQIPDGTSTLTAASFTGLTPAKLEAMGKTEYNKARVIAEAIEARAVGVIPKTMNTLLMSRITEVKKDKLNVRNMGDGQSIVLPYSYRRRETNIGAEYFNIVSGAANANAGSIVGGISYPTSSWDIVVNVGSSPWASAITNLERYFLPGEYIYVENVDSAGVLGTNRDKRVTSYKVINSVNVTASTARVTIACNRTATAWTGMSAGQKAVYQPIFGVVHSGTAVVADQESWARNQPSDFSKSLIIDWHQTSRYTQAYNDEYAKNLKAVLDGEINEVEKNFNWLSLAEQNKRQRKVYDDKWAKDLFFGDIIDENQLNPEYYDRLPPIQDVEDGTVYGYKSHALGLRTLLANDSRVIDLHGGPLDLSELFDLSYSVKRHREADGSTCDCIDWMTDKDTAHALHVKIIGWLKATYGYDITMWFKAGEVLDATTNVARFKYNRYDIPGRNIQIAVFVDSFFDDRILNFTDGSSGSVAYRESARSIWLIDWSDFNVGVVATNSAKREYRGKATADANALFSTVITLNAKHYDLRSTTWTTQIGDSKRHLMIENFSTTVND